MAYQKLQSREALEVIQSDTVKIPDPSSVVNVIDGTTAATDGVTKMVVDQTVANTITATVGTTKFTEMGIQPGAIVYNVTASIAAYVTSVDSDTQLTVSVATTGGAADIIYIYNRATIGCTLFVGTAGDIEVTMAENNGNVTAANTPGNYSPLFKGIANGSFLPIQVIQVYATRTSAADVIALW